MSDKQKLKYYIVAMERLLSKQERTSYVLDVLDEVIDEGDVNIITDFFGDGACLLGEIRDEIRDMEG